MATSSRPKVLVTNIGAPEEGLHLLRKHCDVIVNEIPTKEGILSKVHGVDAIFLKQPAIIDKEIIEAAGPQLKVLSMMSRGYNFVDTHELDKRGIKWTNLQGQSQNAVADFTLLLMLATSRRLHEARLAIDRSEWDINNKQWMLGRDIRGSIIGIIGFGYIGQAIVKRLKGFDVKRVLYTGPHEKGEGKYLGAEFVSQDTLIEESDFVIISCPLTDVTRKMCNANFFSKMKKNAIFINVARGDIVDQDALIEYLKNGHLFAAGLDVTTPEPLPAEHELLKLPNVVLTPHMAFKTTDTIKEMALCAVTNILNYLNIPYN